MTAQITATEARIETYRAMTADGGGELTGIQFSDGLKAAQTLQEVVTGNVQARVLPYGIAEKMIAAGYMVVNPNAAEDAVYINAKSHILTGKGIRWALNMAAKIGGALGREAADELSSVLATAQRIVTEHEAAQAVIVTEETAVVEVVETVTAPAELIEGVAFTLDGKPAIIRNGKIFAALHPAADDSETGAGNIKLGWKIIGQYNTAAAWVAKGFSLESLDIDTQRVYVRIGGLPVSAQAPDYAAWLAFYDDVYSNS